MPFQIVEIIRALMVVSPNFRLVQSIIGTHGVPRMPASATIPRPIQRDTPTSPGKV
jgi:hypothetical protein